MKKWKTKLRDELAWLGSLGVWLWILSCSPENHFKSLTRPIVTLTEEKKREHLYFHITGKWLPHLLRLKRFKLSNRTCSSYSWEAWKIIVKWEDNLRHKKRASYPAALLVTLAQECSFVSARNSHRETLLLCTTE